MGSGIYHTFIVVKKVPRVVIVIILLVVIFQTLGATGYK